MGEKIKSESDAHRLFLKDFKKRAAELAKEHKPAGRDEAVIRAASYRDRLKFIPNRLN